MIIRNIIIATALFFNISTAYAQGNEMPEQPLMSQEELFGALADDVVLGDENAPVTIIEYASMSCSHCAAFHNNVFSHLKEKYIDTGKVRFIFRDFPLDEPALRAAMMARCAAQEGEDKFVKFVKVMFSTQSNWAPKKNYLEILSNIGKLGGMTGEQFEQCIADKDLEYSIMNSKFQAAKQLGVSSTPTFFMNRKIYRGGQTTEFLSKQIDSIIGSDETPNIHEQKEE